MKMDRLFQSLVEYSEAWDDGYEAYMAGKSITKNPHKNHAGKRQQWIDGFMAGRDDYYGTPPEDD